MSETTRRYRNPYRIRDERVWIQIKARYLKGESARWLAEVFGVTEYAINKRRRREGWTKRAQAQADAEQIIRDAEAAAPPWGVEGHGEDAAAGADGPLDPRAAAQAALAEAARLMRARRPAEAAAAARVADLMARAAARLEAPAAVEMVEEDEAAVAAVRAKVEAMIAAATAGEAA